jgi:secreted trypsin-like serine protease
MRKRPFILLLILLIASLRAPLAHAQTIARPTIVGGTNAAMAEFPHQVLVLVAGYMCGGSIIADQYILTAAHCMVDDLGNPYTASQVTVYAGLQNMGSLAKNALNPYFLRRTVSAVTVHASFDTETYDFDVAVLKLSSPIVKNPGIKIIKLAHSATTYSALYATRKVLTVSGWGAVKYNGDTSNTLRKVQVPVVANTTCNTYYGSGITGRMMCAGYATGGKDSCQGDSGGPIIASIGTTPYQVGIVSWGNGCAKARYPGVYTRISSVYPWIKAIAKLSY